MNKKERWMVKRSIIAGLLGILSLPMALVSGQKGSGEALEFLVPLSKVGLSPSYGSVTKLKDGGLLWVWGTRGKDPSMYGNFSIDGGRAWSNPFPMKLDDGQPMRLTGAASLVRLPSGGLGLALSGPEKFLFHVSRDEGKSWSPGVPVHSGNQDVVLTNDRALVLSSGRAVLPVYTRLQGPNMPVRKPRVTRFGADFDAAWAHWMMYSYVLYSDDEGRTWQRSANEVFITLDKGMDGIYSAHEPAVAELTDGRLVMFVRTNLGRFYRSYSTDKGKTWLEGQPTPLIGPPAPCSLTPIPRTDDLLAIWNQVSAFEEMEGLYRHRLSTAVSSDGGMTWKHFRNLESLDDTTQVEDGVPRVVLLGPGRQPLDRKRYQRAPGPLRASYPTCTFLNGNAVITYGLSTLGDKEVITRTYGMDYDELVRRLGMGPEARANKVRIVPASWFYGK